ncbi:hypothetical protein QFZ99_001696 [Paraburkholderia atlantica]
MAATPSIRPAMKRAITAAGITNASDGEKQKIAAIGSSWNSAVPSIWLML